MKIKSVTVRILRTMTALSLAAVMIGSSAYAEDPAPAVTGAEETSPFVYYRASNGDIFYDDDFETWNENVLVKDAASAKNLAGIWGAWNGDDRLKTKKADGDMCLSLQPGANGASLLWNAMSNYSDFWTRVQCRFRLTAGSANFQMNSANKGKLINIDENGFTIFPNSGSSQPDVVKPGGEIYNNWYTFKAEFSYKENSYKITVLDDNGTEVLKRAGDDFTEKAYGAANNGSWAMFIFYCYKPADSAAELDISDFRIQSLKDKNKDSAQDIRGPIDETVGGKAAKSYIFTNLKLSDTAETEPIKAGLLGAAYDEAGAFKGASYQSGEFSPKAKGDNTGENEFISKTYTNATSYATVGAVSGRLSSTLEGDKVDTYLLESSEGFKLYGSKAQGKAKISSATISEADQSLTITGSLENRAEGDTDLLYIIKSDANISDLDSDNTKADSIVYIKEMRDGDGMVINDDGSFSYSFMPGFSKGSYTVGIGGSHTTDEAAHIKYYTAADLAEANTDAKNVSTKDDVKDYIEKHGDTFSLTNFVYEKLNVVGGLDAAYEKIAEKKYADAAELNQAISRNLIYAALKNDKISAADKTETVNIFAANSFKLTDLDIWKAYLKAADAREGIVGILSSDRNLSVENFVTSFQESAVAGLVKYNSTIWGDVDSVISAYNESIIKLTSDEYSKYTSEKRNVCQDIINKKGEISDFSDFKETLKALIKTYSTSDTDDSTGKPGSSTGGGGRGSGSGGIRGGKNSGSQTSTTVVVPPKTAEEAKTFNDLASVKWAEKAINTLYQKGYINGKSEKNFDPDSTIKREEFLKMLMNVLEIPTSDAELPFTDVNDDSWFRGYVVGAKEKGICGGVGDNLFGTGMNITRQDMAVMLYNASKIRNVELEKAQDISFDDLDDVSDYARDAVSALSNSGIIKGNNNRFLPNDSATRAEAAVMMYRLYEMLR